MAWTVILEDEKKNPVASLSEEFIVKSIDRLNEFEVLRYLDLYGDTTFNRLQMDDLLRDLNRLKNIEDNPLINEIISLGEKCLMEVHTYLVFYGD